MRITRRSHRRNWVEIEDPSIERPIRISLTDTHDDEMELIESRRLRKIRHQSSGDILITMDGAEHLWVTFEPLGVTFLNEVPTSGATATAVAGSRADGIEVARRIGGRLRAARIRSLTELWQASRSTPLAADAASVNRYLDEITLLAERFEGRLSALRLFQAIHDVRERRHDRMHRGMSESLLRNLERCADELVNDLHTQWVIEKSTKGPRKGGRSPTRRRAIEEFARIQLVRDSSSTLSQLWQSFPTNLEEHGSEVNVHGNSYRVARDGDELVQEQDETGAMSSIKRATFRDYVTRIRQER